jgi:hypothetical protein
VPLPCGSKIRSNPCPLSLHLATIHPPGAYNLYVLRPCHSDDAVALQHRLQPFFLIIHQKHRHKLSPLAPKPCLTIILSPPYHSSPKLQSENVSILSITASFPTQPPGPYIHSVALLPPIPSCMRLYVLYSILQHTL